MSTVTLHPNSTRHLGIVKWFNKNLGFGFIAVAPSMKQEFGIPMDKDLYVHAENLDLPFPRELKPEQRVEFAVEVTAKGPPAVNVSVLASLQPA